MIRSVAVAAGLGTTLIASATASAAYTDTIFTGAADPASYGNLVASLDIASTAWDFPVGASKLDSGYKAEILDGSGNPLALDPGTSPNTTSLRTDVYEVTSATSVGTINLVPGDLAFAYRIGLTGENTNTIETLQKFGVFGLNPDFFPQGDGTFTQDQLLGRAVSVNGLGNPATSFPTGSAGDLEISMFFSQIDFEWEFGNQNAQMNAGEEVTLILFARDAIVIDGFASFAGTAGQAPATTDQNANDAPVLIPGIPTPGSIALVGLGGLAAVRRRRR